MDSDACEAELHEAGWSIGDMAIYASTGVVWMIYGSRAEQRIVVKGPSQSETWRQAAELARPIGQPDCNSRGSEP